MPPHWHLSIFWPDKRQTPPAVMCIPHFYMDDAGRVTSDGFSTTFAGQCGVVEVASKHPGAG